MEPAVQPKWRVPAIVVAFILGAIRGATLGYRGHQAAVERACATDGDLESRPSAL